ncbi:MAG: hypothetical protein V2A70_08810, partial [Candidatus Omnitrophota bacterium]
SIHLLILMEMAQRGAGRCGGLWVGLGLVHALMALTFSAAGIQIVMALVYIGVMLPKDISLSRIGYVFIAPLAIIVYYYAVAIHFVFYMPRVLGGCFNNTFSLEAMLALLALLMYTISSYLHNLKGIHQTGIIRWADKPGIFLTAGYLTAGILMCGMYFLLLVFFWIQSRPMAPGVFYFAFRYFVALVPVGIMIMVMASQRIWTALIPLWSKILFVLLLVLMLAGRLNFTFQKVWIWIGI